MRINRVELFNFGIYEGLNCFDFIEDPKKNTHVILGENGAGKTTFLNGLKIGMYGPLYFGYINNESVKYKEIILTKINNNYLDNWSQICMFAKENPFIQIFFTMEHKGIEEEFILKREWIFFDQIKFKENLQIKKNAEILSLEESAQFIQFLSKKMPIKLYDLFWFDGEKLSLLLSMEEDLSEMLDTAFNLSLVKALKDDLKFFIKNKTAAAELINLFEEEETYEMKIKETQDNLRNKEIEIRELERQKEATKGELRNIQNEIEMIGGMYSSELKSMIIQRNEKIVKREKIKQTNNDLIINKLPLFIAKPILEEVNQQIDVERELFEDQVAIKKMQSIMENEPDLYMAAKAIRLYIGSNFKQTLMHNINPYEYAAYKNSIEDILSRDPVEIFENIKKIAKLGEEISEINKKIAVSTSEEVKELVFSIEEYNQRVIRIEDNLDRKREDLEKLMEELLAFEKHLDSIKASIKELSKDQNLEKVVANMAMVLNEFSNTIREQKMKELSDDTSDMFKRLIRKDDFIERVSIRGHGEISIENKLGFEIPIGTLSSGEKQILILSIIFSLVNISKIEIPVIFDTLLGRLDKTHRDHIIEYYLPKISDQVIILATDSEIDDSNRNHKLEQILINIEHLEKNSNNKTHINENVTSRRVGSA